MNVLIKAATIIEPDGEYHGKKRDIAIRDGIIEKIAVSIPAMDESTRVVKLKNLHVSRGWFDCSVSFGEPGFEERETLESGLKVAASSGYTDLILNPSTQPVPDSSGDIRFLIEKSSKAPVSLYPLGTITKESKGLALAELYDMHRHGALGFSEDQKHLMNAQLLQLALQYTSLFDGCVWTFPLDAHLTGRGLVHEGTTAVHLGLKGIPSMAEEIALMRDLKILEYTGGKLHVSLISAEESVKLLAEAKRKGRDVSAAASINHLYFTDEDLNEFDSNLKLMPPIRSRKDRKALREGLLSGTIDMITSDHRPFTTEEKEVEFNMALPGAIGLETAFGALQSIFGLETAIGLLTRGRERFGLSDYPIRVGEEARLSFFDPDRKYVYLPAMVLSKSRNSPFLGKELQGLSYGIFAKNRLLLRPNAETA